MSYRMAAPDDFLATSKEVNGINVKLFQPTPFQRSMGFITQRLNFSMNLQDMTKDKDWISLPVVFTVGPDVQRRSCADARHNDIPDHDCEDWSDLFTKYAASLSNKPNRKAILQLRENTVKSIIEGETCLLVSSMTMEEILTEHEGFMKRLCCNIQSELSQFGLCIFHASVEELHGVPGMELHNVLAIAHVLAKVNLPRPPPILQIPQKETDTPQSHLGHEGPLISAGTWGGLRSVADDMHALTPIQRDLDASIKNAKANLYTEPKKAELGIAELYKSVNAALTHALTPIQRDLDDSIKNAKANLYKELISMPALFNAVNATLMQTREEQLEHDCKYLDLGYFPNPNITDVDGHVRSRGGSVDDVVKTILDEDGWHHHDGRRPPTRLAHGHGHGSSRLVPVAERPLAGHSKGNGHRFSPLPAKLMSGLCIIWGLGVPVALAHRIPDWLLHIVGGTTVAAGACVPVLQPAEGETKAYKTGAYIAWAVTFAIFITMELYRRQDQRRLLLGLVIFCGANLLGSLAEDSSTTIDTIKNWGPLALSLSLCVVPEWIQLMGARQVVDSVAGA